MVKINPTQDPWTSQRRQMVKSQIEARGITDQAVLEAMRQVPRHLFVPEKERDAAYADCALPIGYGQTISQPYMVAIMTQHLELSGGEKVLEIGTGSGYQAAVLSRLAGEVYTIDRVPELTEKAGKILAELGLVNIRIKTGDGNLGWADKAPFDRILVTAGCTSIPKPLLEQLAVGGKIAAPVGDPGVQILTLVTKKKDGCHAATADACVFVPLVGPCGW